MENKIQEIEKRLQYLPAWMEKWIDRWPRRPRYSSFEAFITKHERYHAHLRREHERRLAKQQCKYCRRQFIDTNMHLRTRDHVVPLSRGGKNNVENKVWACIPCNRWKDNKYLSEWKEEIEELLKKWASGHTTYLQNKLRKRFGKEYEFKYSTRHLKYILIAIEEIEAEQSKTYSYGSPIEESTKCNLQDNHGVSEQHVPTSS